MQISDETIQTAKREGSEQASVSFSKLAGAKVQVNTSEVVHQTLQEVADKLTVFHSTSPVFAYSQVIEGVNGVSFLIMTREEAFEFIDLLNNKPLGTTGVLMDVDRSAIKETLNILSNSYINHIVKHTDASVIVGDPRLITMSGVKELLGHLSGLSEKVIVFRTVLEIAQRQIHAELYLVFNEQLVQLMHSNN